MYKIKMSAYKVQTFLFVELSRIELESKHIRRKLSTCLLLHYLSGNSRSSTNQLFP